eukprot:7389947-Prymnesium_polylepis.1
MGVEELKDQLKGYKLQGKTGFKLTHEKRADYVLQVQSLMSEALGEGSNDLKDGESGVEGRGVRRRKHADNGDEPEKKKRKSKVKMASWKGWEWPANKKFEIDKLIGKMVAEGEVPGRSNVKAGTVLYKVLWKDFPPVVRLQLGRRSRPSTTTTLTLMRPIWRQRGRWKRKRKRSSGTRVTSLRRCEQMCSQRRYLVIV